MAVDFTKVPVGTKVVTFRGVGVIRANNEDDLSAYSIDVLVGEQRLTFTRDGRYHRDDAHPVLFLAPFDWPAQEQPSEPLPKIEVDTPVWVRDNYQQPWKRRHFKAWASDRQCYVWADGYTSHSSDAGESGVPFQLWSLTDPDATVVETTEPSKSALPNLAVDTPVWVRLVDERSWKPRHFKAWAGGGRMIVFGNGETSHTEDRAHRVAIEWSLIDPTKVGK